MWYDFYFKNFLLLCNKVSSAVKLIDPSLSSMLVGSYRRGKDSSGDIDVMIVKADFMKSKVILSKLLVALKASGQFRRFCTCFYSLLILRRELNIFN